MVLRADTGAAFPGAPREVRGARTVASQALTFRHAALHARPALVNGAPGVVTVAEGRVVSVLGFTIVDGLVVELDILADPERLAGLDPAEFGE